MSRLGFSHFVAMAIAAGLIISSHNLAISQKVDSISEFKNDHTSVSQLKLAQFNPPLLSLNFKENNREEVKNQSIFEQIITKGIKANLSNASLPKIIQFVAKEFLGAKYQTGLLDQSVDESLVVSLDRFDCLLFVETVLAITRNFTTQDYQYQTFTNYLVNERYRNGNMNGYCSRLHYFSEWISDNEARGNVEEIASRLGGIPLHKKLNFMSSHRHSYPQMVNDEANYQCILETETRLESLNIRYIPQAQIRKVYNQLQAGDIIGVATNIPGLDVTHTGLVYPTANGNIGLIHASPIGQVTVAQDLQSYVGNVKNAIGILIARPIDPRF